MYKTFTTALTALGLTASLAWADVTANKEFVLDMMENVFSSRDASAVDAYFA